MASRENTIAYLNSPDGEAYLSKLYGSSPEVVSYHRARYCDLLAKFNSFFPDPQELFFFSAPGRTEVGGNHTDHNAGRVLAAAVDLDILAVVARNEEGIIRIHSEGYPLSEINIGELDAVETEKNTSPALIRGVCARIKQLGYRIGGFDAVAFSLVPKGSGLSSSAAYEVLFATVINHLYNQERIDPVLLAQIGQYAENQYFGKPCGLMDQMTSAVGGFVTIDFKNSANPIVHKVEFDFTAQDYTMVISNTRGDHAHLTDEYAAIEGEMKSVARVLGGTVLREFSEENILANISHLRTKVSDRAILRAIHFFRDDERVVQQVQALEANDFRRFLRLVNESGRSSWTLCQNCYSHRSIEKQGISIGLAASEAILGQRGAWRVHGGGFAGTIQAFVPNDMLREYIEKLESIFGVGSCHSIRVRAAGALKMLW